MRHMRAGLPDLTEACSRVHTTTNQGIGIMHRVHITCILTNCSVMGSLREDVPKFYSWNLFRSRKTTHETVAPHII
jgi:hypothetical protein